MAFWRSIRQRRRLNKIQQRFYRLCLNNNIPYTSAFLAAYGKSNESIYLFSKLNEYLINQTAKLDKLVLQEIGHALDTMPSLEKSLVNFPFPLS
jgi:hypothetical protein